MKILVTGAAGFIGFHLSKILIEQNHEVLGLDNLNDYYDVSLKISRLRELGVDDSFKLNPNQKASGHKNFIFFKADICDATFLEKLFKKTNFDIVVHLAAQAGVRYSITNPDTYIESNINGYYNILKNCKNHNVEHFIYASSSSVYGNSKNVTFSTNDVVDEPISLYAATKKSNELMAYTYSHLYNMKTTGLRFFTVYGPWGRPDMAYFKFAKSILANETIPVYNNGELERDFTYIGDIINGIVKIIDQGFKSNTSNKNYAIYNIGNGKPVKLIDFIKIIEKHLNKKSMINLLPMQDGDVYKTWADISELEKNYGYKPKTDLNKGIKSFIDWFEGKKKCSNK